MKSLANENIPLDLVKELKNSSYDVWKMDKSKKGIVERDVRDLSFKEDRILDTFDKDFGKLAVKEKKGTVVIIWLRIHQNLFNILKIDSFCSLRKLKN
jgi:predicted nuclease of predicted toxin-antitoxin system